MGKISEKRIYVNDCFGWAKKRTKPCLDCVDKRACIEYHNALLEELPQHIGPVYAPYKSQSYPGRRAYKTVSPVSELPYAHTTVGQQTYVLFESSYFVYHTKALKRKLGVRGSLSLDSWVIHRSKYGYFHLREVAVFLANSKKKLKYYMFIFTERSTSIEGENTSEPKEAKTDPS